MAITKKAVAVRERKAELMTEYRAAIGELNAVCNGLRVPDAVVRGDAVLAARWKDRVAEARSVRPALSSRQTADEIQHRIGCVRNETAWLVNPSLT